MITVVLCTPQDAGTGGGVGSTTATIYITNRTTGASMSYNFSAPGGTKLVGNSAEWIVEAPQINGAQSAIADYDKSSSTSVKVTQLVVPP